jgi:copper oxidase (laccase) domain-containing protein
MAFDNGYNNWKQVHERRRFGTTARHARVYSIDGGVSQAKEVAVAAMNCACV